MVPGYANVVVKLPSQTLTHTHTLAHTYSATASVSLRFRLFVQPWLRSGAVDLLKGHQKKMLAAFLFVNRRRKITQ